MFNLGKEVNLTASDSQIIKITSTGYIQKHSNSHSAVGSSSYIEPNNTMKTQWSKNLSGYKIKKENETIGERGEERGKNVGERGKRKKSIDYQLFRAIEYGNNIAASVFYFYTLIYTSHFSNNKPI